MRFARTFVLAFFSLSLVSTSFPQQTATTVQRDPQALVVLTQVVNATGGATALAAVQDFTASGTITFNWAGEHVQGSLTVQGKGLHQFRMDAIVPGGRQSLVVNGYAGAFTPAYGQKMMLPAWSAVTSDSLTFPAARIISALSDPSTTLIYVGPVTWRGSQVCQVHVAPLVDRALNPNGFSALGAFDLYIDLASYEVQGLSEMIWWSGNFAQAYRHELAFSNYTTAHGLLVPFAVTEELGGQQTWTLQLSAFALNTGLSDANFHL